MCGNMKNSSVLGPGLNLLVHSNLLLYYGKEYFYILCYSLSVFFFFKITSYCYNCLCCASKACAYYPPPHYCCGIVIDFDFDLWIATND